jgi:arylsulfatase A-like enzyme
MNRTFKNLLLLVCLVVAPARAEEKPNIILIMADDLGYGELGCYGSQNFATPNIDALAKSGLRMTDFHSNGAVCSPTRAALMTGRYQQRCGIDGVVTAKSHRETGMDLEEETFAELLKRAGYATAMFGKWHLGYDPKFNPTRQGFDEFQGFVSGNIDLFSHIDQEFWFDWWISRDLRYVPGYAPHRITELGIEFIRKNVDRPFFLYLPHPAPHYPYQGPGDQANRSVRQGFEPVGLQELELAPTLSGTEAARAYKQMVEDLDAQVGRIVAVLEEQKIRENSLVIFCSDNGGTGNKSLGSDNGPLRGRKGQIYEGGHRVAGIFNWPGKIKPGTSDQTALSFDLMPTFAELAGVTPQAEPDGLSLKGLLLNRDRIGPRPLLWMTGTKTAYRVGDWKLLIQGEKIELFNLRADLSESKDLSATQPGRKKRMMTEALRLRQTIRGARTMKTGQL